MALYKPSDLRAYLESLGIRPRKGLSQNFLIDGNIVRKIVAAADIKPGDVVLEIGPGPGAVSEAIVEAGGRLIAVEMDKILAKALERLDGATIYCQDFLDFDLDLLPKNIKVITNLPYHIATPIISKLITEHERFSRIVVMVQDEMARRMIAKPKTADFSSFTVFLEFFSDVKYAFKVSRQCFYPAPKVNSAVVTLDLKPHPEVDVDAFFKLTRAAFGQRRKMLRNTLKELYPSIENMECKNCRPEELSLNQFLALYRDLTA